MGCEVSCPLLGAVEVQQMCRKRGLSIRAALARWVDSPMRKEKAKQIIEDVLGMSIEEIHKRLGEEA